MMMTPLQAQSSNMRPPSTFLHTENAAGDRDIMSNNWSLTKPAFSADPGCLITASGQSTHLPFSGNGSFSSRSTGVRRSVPCSLA
ncbi:hypothetical protein J008_06393 [Cryptococcus neoformans]|nr:hypothetical protein C362_06363 [Cryptococcus neoformans var. grubii Bt1]OXG11891.1 hypothetical protein C367_06360 [Cryptococcus neoformans var. grubii Ze90-1]OXH22491.1 hypothetical protein J008_06393 [Cryptococcus neoformans var. grubii]